MAGLTENGFEAKRQPEIQEELEAAIAGDDALQGLNTRAGPIQQIIGAVSEQAAKLWELGEAVYGASYPTTSGVLLDRLAALTGTTRRAATRSRVTATVTLAGLATLPAGSIAAVDGDPDAQFRSVEAVTNPSGSEDDIEAVFESVATGPVAAPMNTLTVIVSSVTGWNAITNAAAAELGEPIADDVELRTQRNTELAGAGAGTLDSTRAAVARVDGVLSVTVYENVTMATVDGRPAKSFEAVVWDGLVPAAANNALAQAIWDHKPGGMQAFGTRSGTAIDAAGAEKTVYFTRATVLRTYVVMEVELVPGTGAGWENEVKAAVSARGDLYAVGQRGFNSQIVAAVHDNVPAIEAITDELKIGIVPGPSTTAVTPAYNQIIRIAEADVTPVEG